MVEETKCVVHTKPYVFEAQWNRHLSMSHGIQYPEMICKMCFMEFNTEIEKKAHERKHNKIYSCQKRYTEHSIAKQPYLCTKCGKRFSQKISLVLHNRSHGPHFCSMCCRFFNEDLPFLLHMKNHGPAHEINFLNNIERLDQEENHLEEMMNSYFRANSSSLDLQIFKEIDQDVSRCVDSMVNAVSDVLEADIQSSEPSQKNGGECKPCGLEMSSATDLLDHRQDLKTVHKVLALGSDTIDTVQVLSLNPVFRPERPNHLNICIQSKEFKTNTAPVSFIKNHSFIPLHKLHICNVCKNLTFREHRCITDQNKIINSEQCSTVTEELPDLKSDSKLVKHSVVIAEQGTVLEKLSSSTSEGTINETLINGTDESLYENLTALTNQDLGAASDQMLIQNVMVQPSSVVPLKFSNENVNVLMITLNPPVMSNPPSVLVQPIDINSLLTTVTLPFNMSSLKIEGTLSLPTSTGVSLETNNCTTNKALEEEKNTDMSANTATVKAVYEIHSIDCPLPQMSDSKINPNDAVKNVTYDCKICKKQFDHETAWEDHLQEHYGVKPLKCETCGKMLKDKYSLKQHSRLHTGDLPHKCYQCNKLFRYLKELTEHKMRHKGIKPYECTECGKEFLRQWNLQRHRNTHSNKTV